MQILFLFSLLIRYTSCLVPSRRDLLSNLVLSPSILTINKNSNKKSEIKKYLLNENLVDERSQNIIQQNNNDIYFYSSVTHESCFELSRRLIEIDKTSQN